MQATAGNLRTSGEIEGGGLRERTASGRSYLPLRKCPERNCPKFVVAESMAVEYTEQELEEDLRLQGGNTQVNQPGSGLLI